jgi:hypothetical protein
MRKLSLFLTIGLLAGVTSYADDDKKKPEAIEEPATADAHIRPIDKSGIEARVAFLDTGSAMPGLVVSGIAKGLDPTQKYFSLIYDNGSVAVGPTACEPTSNGSVNGPQMPVGFWNVNKDGTGTLFAIKSGPSYAKIGTFRTISIRIVLGPPPAGFQLRACGLVRIEDQDEQKKEEDKGDN